MNRTLFLVSIAAVIGVLIVVIPTWVALTTSSSRMFAEHISGWLPLIPNLEQAGVAVVSVREAGVFGLGLAGALVIYIVARRGVNSVHSA